MEYTIGKKISELRRERNMTQEDLAEAMGVSSQAVSKWETELSCPDIMTLSPLALQSTSCFLPTPLTAQSYCLRTEEKMQTK